VRLRFELDALLSRQQAIKWGHMLSIVRYDLWSNSVPSQDYPELFFFAKNKSIIPDGITIFSLKYIEDMHILSAPWGQVHRNHG
jgi:hypothetical protein